VRLKLTGRPWWTYAVAVFLCVGAFILIAGDRGFLELGRLRDEHARIKAANDELSRKNLDLSAQVGRLTRDPEAVEAIAREQLGMVKEGEVVYYLTPEEKAPVKPAANQNGQAKPLEAKR